MHKGLLYHFLPEAVPPPPALWNTIDNALDADGTAAIEKDGGNPFNENKQPLNTVTGGSLNALAALEVEPPAIVWQNITLQLNRTTILPKVAGGHKIRSIWVAAVAAACFGSVLFIAPMLKNRKEAKAVSTNIGSKMMDTSGKADSVINSLLPESKTNDSLPKKQMLFPPATIHFLQVTGVNGNKVKLSPKLAPLVPVLKYGGNARLSPQNKIWQQLFTTWKLQFNYPAENPAAVNFADPIDLIRFLQRKK